MMDVEKWLNKYHVRETLVLITSVGMLFWVTRWSMTYASVVHGTGMDVAAVIAAVQVPASFYAKWAFEIFAGRLKE